MKSGEQEILVREILVPIGQNAAKIPEKMITGLLSVEGHSYNQNLMIIGIAGNGWIEGVQPVEMADKSQAERFANEIIDSVSGKVECPMKWVTDQWGATSGYNTKKSQFWNVIRKVTYKLGIADEYEDDWPSCLVWSNLYKISPDEGGNPSKTLRDVQQYGCNSILKSELVRYRPRHLLFLTGLGLIEQFQPALELNEKRISMKYVEAVARINLDTDYVTKVVIAAHPRGKKQSEWVNEVTESFLAYM